MEDFLWLIVAPIVEFFGYVFDADERRVARGITVGCGILLVLAAVVVGVIFLH